MITNAIVLIKINVFILANRLHLGIGARGLRFIYFVRKKARNQELGKRVTSWCEMRVVRVNIVEKVFLKSFAIWRKESKNELITGVYKRAL